MQQYKYSDALLWHSLPEGAVVRAFFSEDRERRLLVYRRKDGTYSYTDQALTFDEYEQEYWWRGTDNELSFYDSEEGVLADLAARTCGMYGFPLYCEEENRPDAVSALPAIPCEAVAFLYRRKGLPEGGRAFLSADGMRRLTAFRRGDGFWSYAEERLCIFDEEELFHSSCYAAWTQRGTGGVYESEATALREVAPLIAGMRELLQEQGE